MPLLGTIASLSLKLYNTCLLFRNLKSPILFHSVLVLEGEGLIDAESVLLGFLDGFP